MTRQTAVALEVDPSEPQDLAVRTACPGAFVHEPVDANLSIRRSRPTHTHHDRSGERYLRPARESLDMMGTDLPHS